MEDAFFRGFGNENGYRNYPFSETSSMEDSNGLVLPTDVFIDALLHPVNPSGLVRMSKLDCAEGIVEFSDDSGVIAMGKLVRGYGRVQLFNSFEGSDYLCEGKKPYDRRVGTLVCGPGFDRELSAGMVREFDDDAAVLAPSSVCPIAYSGVTSVVIEGDITAKLSCRMSVPQENVTLDNKVIGLFGCDNLVCKTSVENGKSYLWFDVLQEYSDKKDIDIYPYNDRLDGTTPPKRAVSNLIVAVEAGSAFAVADAGADDYIVTLCRVDREDVCYQANLAANVVKGKIDTCSGGGGDDDDMKCHPGGGGSDPGCPAAEFSSSGVSDVAFLTPDFANYRNPVWIGVDGSSVSHIDFPKITNDMSEDTAIYEIQKLHKRPIKTGGGLEIAIPGLLG